ncbi:hypothetical protein C1H46_003093 [Malus baccata]|uniref:Splicing factor 3A subunit 1 conserved domain-containing protein n=1 Tax=Malus baccata TaxID=106549 RepID=A0A540NK00_MALBA|nr:hypothetical protein C1H46_003093 [Malus baccata]
MIGSILPLPAPPSDGDLGPFPESQVTEVNQDEKQLDEELSKANSTSVATHTRAIGIIHPPPDIRNIVDKTAQFSSGQLPYTQPVDFASPESAPPTPVVDGETRAPKPDPSAQFRPVRKVLKPPQAEEYTVRLPEDFADDEDEDLPPLMTLEEIIRRNKVADMEEDVEPGKEVEMEMNEEKMQLVEEGLRTSRLEENDDEKKNENMVTEDPEPPMRIVKNWKRPEDRIPTERDPTKYVISTITGELIPINEMSEHMRISLIDPKYKKQKERMFAKIRETTLAQDDEILRNIVGLARTRPDIFGTTEEEVSNAVKAEIEKKKDEQPKQVIWDGHTGSIGHTTNQAMSQNINGEDQNDGLNNDARNLPGPEAPPPRPGVPSIRPLPPPPGLALNLPRPPNTVQYFTSTSGGLPAPPPRPSVVQYQ